MGKLAYVPFAVSGATTTVDLVECAPASGKPITVRGFLVGQKSEITEAQEEVLDIRLTRFTGGTITSGSGGGSGTAFDPDGTDTAVGATFETGNTTLATRTVSGTTDELRFPAQVRNTPFEYWFPAKEFGFKARSTDLILLRIGTAPADAIDLWGWICIEEE